MRPNSTFPTTTPLAYVYLDNAATTPMSKEVFDSMEPFLKEHFGNPSSIHGVGLIARGAISEAGRIVSDYLHTAPDRITFSSGATESSNAIIKSCVRDLGVRRIITSPIEHHCVLSPIKEVEQYYGVAVAYVNLTDTGSVDYEHLRTLLSRADSEKTLVCLMHGNNEIGTLTDVDVVGSLCKEVGALYFCDAVQSVGYYPINPAESGIHFMTGSAHKFHGPKGVGFMYCATGLDLKPYITGGGQQAGKRAGTENVYGIVGLGRALHQAVSNMSINQDQIQGMKSWFIEALTSEFKDVQFNGNIDTKTSSYKVLSVSFSAESVPGDILDRLDQSGVAVSGSSACSGNSSHVLGALKVNPTRRTVRFSFSRYTHQSELDHVLTILRGLRTS